MSGQELLVPLSFYYRYPHYSRIILTTHQAYTFPFITEEDHQENEELRYKLFHDSEYPLPSAHISLCSQPGLQYHRYQCMDEKDNERKRKHWYRVSGLSGNCWQANPNSGSPQILNYGWQKLEWLWELFVRKKKFSIRNEDLSRILDSPQYA